MLSIFKEKPTYLDFLHIPINLDAGRSSVHCHISRFECRKSQNMKTGNSSFERVKEFKYLGTTLLNQNSIQEEINP